MAKTAVIGLGNPYVADEGIGLRIVAALNETFDCADIDVYDLGTASFRIIHIVADRAKVVIIDCALMGEPPATLRRFTLEQARSVKNLRHHSLHEGDLFEVLALTAADGQALPEMVIFGIEPATLELGEGLSSPLANRLPEYAAAVAAECGLVRRDGP